MIRGGHAYAHSRCDHNYGTHDHNYGGHAHTHGRCDHDSGELGMIMVSMLKPVAGAFMILVSMLIVMVGMLIIMVRPRQV